MPTTRWNGVARQPRLAFASGTLREDTASMSSQGVRARWLIACNPGLRAWTISRAPLGGARAFHCGRMTMGETAPAVEVAETARPWWEQRWFLALVVLATMIPLVYPP